MKGLEVSSYDFCHNDGDSKNGDDNPNDELPVDKAADTLPIFSFDKAIQFFSHLSFFLFLTLI